MEPPIGAPAPPPHAALADLLSMEVDEATQLAAATGCAERAYAPEAVLTLEGLSDRLRQESPGGQLTC